MMETVYAVIEAIASFKGQRVESLSLGNLLDKFATKHKKALQLESFLQEANKNLFD